MGQTTPHVLIIGGGLGGLCLAQGLKKANISFRLFERDPTSDYRPQGYRLRINGEGAAALKQNLSAELWSYFERTCSDVELGETDINAIDGSIFACRAGGGPAMRGMVPHTADRTVLRDILLAGLEEDISFGKVFERYEVTETGVVAYFGDGSSVEGTLLVGADGIRSLVRKQYLPDQKVLDTDGSCIYGKTLMTPELLERFPTKGMRWMTLVVDKTPMTQTLDTDETPITLLLEPIRWKESDLRVKLPKDYMYWVLVARKAAFGLTDDQMRHLTGGESAKLSQKITENWDPAIRSLLEFQDTTQSSALRIASAYPEIVPWKPSDRVTLVGDSIHVMSPCGGVGAVTALRDGATLASALIEGGFSAESIGKYEETMRGYAQLGIQRSYFGGKKIFGQSPFDLCKPMDM
jgi:2-polyprenyl-6-methoxyphenol hydroxylase-like FAD-dependent oxidoreductase